MALCNRQEIERGRLAEEESIREKEMGSEGKAGNLTDGLTGWIVELGGCC